MEASRVELVRTQATPRSKARGFTLLELMVTLGVAAIVLSAGVPGFIGVVQNNRAASQANELVTALSLARSEAVRRSARVGVCQSADGLTCGGAGWQQGWIVFEDGAATDTAAPIVTEVLRAWPALNDNAAVAVPSQWLRFLPHGEVRAPVALPLTYDMQVHGCAGDQGRQIELNAIGRTSVARIACI